jgi:NAD(P)-dependent dehydrogenase (short-subunit alcohol dehydrogenase family)
MKKTVLITGASSGLGKATAKFFAAHHWNVAATMRTPEAETELTGASGVRVIRLDVQDRASIDRALAETIAQFGRIDALINNAGFSLFGVFEAIPPEKIQEQFAVNVFGVMDVTRAILPHFRQHRSGLIMNISSRAGLVALPLNSLYCATKFALEGFSEALAYELASQHITVKLVEVSGGAGGTNFGRRMSSEYEATAAPAGYAEFIARASAIYNAMRTSGQLTSADDVARTVYHAATDDTDQLRYLVGNDTPPFINARREMAEPDYVNYMRSHFSQQG